MTGGGIEMRLKINKNRGKYSSAKEIEIKIDQIRARVERVSMPYIM